MRKELKFHTMAELKRIVQQVKIKHPNCRCGQAMINEFELNKHIEDKICESDDWMSIAKVIFNHKFNGEI